MRKKGPKTFHFWAIQNGWNFNTWRHNRENICILYIICLRWVKSGKKWEIRQKSSIKLTMTNKANAKYKLHKCPIYAFENIVDCVGLPFKLQKINIHINMCKYQLHKEATNEFHLVSFERPFIECGFAANLRLIFVHIYRMQIKQLHREATSHCLSR